MDAEQADLVIVGAGIYGIQTAKTYIQLHPDRKVVILEAGQSLGGTWSGERIYPGLRTNNTLGWLEFPDMPITEEEFNVKPGDHIDGEVLNAYLEAYTRRFSVTRHIRLRTKVISISESKQGGWIVDWQLQDSAFTSSPQKGIIHASKLVIATGHTSEPLLPSFPGQDQLQKPLFHTKDWSKHQSLSSTAKVAAVLGGGKSAFDAAYMFADKGIKTHMIIRATGHGPAWMVKYHATPFKIGLESLAMSRPITWFSPCIWGSHDGYGIIRNFLHRTWLGQKITRLFWKIVQADSIEVSGIKGHPGTEELIPWTEFFWSGTSCSILNYEKDWFQFVRNGLIEVHVADVDQFSKGSIHLSSGEVLKVDAVVCATTWKHRPAFDFLPASIESQLGLPHYSSNPDPDGRLVHADQKVLETFPQLKAQPVINSHLAMIPTKATETFDHTRYNVPYLLYKFMVPQAYLRARSIAFAGVPLTFHQGQMSTAQALWICAYFDGNIRLPESQDDIADEIALHARFPRWRNPAGYGTIFPDWIFDTLPWLDMVLGDVGVHGWKKPGLTNIFTSYKPRLFAGLVEEYQRRYQD